MTDTPLPEDIIFPTTTLVLAQTNGFIFSPIIYETCM